MDFEKNVSKPKSFRELNLREDVKTEEIVETFHDYVISGAAIHAATVIVLLDRSRANISHLGSIGEGISIGMRDQERRGFPLDADEYRRLGEYVSDQINSINQKIPEG